MVFVTQNKVRMHDTDMAGRLYFARQFRFVNDALEDLVYDEGLDYNRVGKDEHFMFVIVHCEADYYAQLTVGNRLNVHVSCERIGKTSFTLLYQIYRGEKEIVGISRTVHVTIDVRTGDKIPIPEKLLTLLNKHLIGPSKP